MQSTAEIEKKLAARDVPPEVAPRGDRAGAGYGYIDDAALAGQLARGMRARGYGRRRAEQKLRSRGLPGALAEAALAEAYGGVTRAARPRGARSPSREARGRRRRDRVSRPPRLLGPRGVEGRSGGAARRPRKQTGCRFREMPMPAHYAVTEGLIAGAYPGTPRPSRASSAAASRCSSTSPTHPTRSMATSHLLDGARRIAHPIPDMGTPTAGHVIQILDDIDTVRADGGTVYVHCWGGIGRTGTVIGCRLVRHGLDGGDAIARIAELRREIPAAPVAGDSRPGRARPQLEAGR